MVQEEICMDLLQIITPEEDLHSAMVARMTATAAIVSVSIGVRGEIFHLVVPTAAQRQAGQESSRGVYQWEISPV